MLNSLLAIWSLHETVSIDSKRQRWSGTTAVGHPEDDIAVGFCSTIFFSETANRNHD